MYIPGDLSKLNTDAQVKLRVDVRSFVVTSTSAEDSDIEGVDLFAGSIIVKVRFKQGAIDLEVSSQPLSLIPIKPFFVWRINHELT